MDKKQFLIVTDRIWQILKSQGEQAAQDELLLVNNGLGAHNQRTEYERKVNLTVFLLYEGSADKLIWTRYLGPV
jgi:hypothetical protein